MKPRPFLNFVWSSFLTTGGVLVNLLGFGLAVVMIFVVPSAVTLTLNWVLLIVFSLITVLASTARVAWEAYKSYLDSYELQGFTPPKVLFVKDPPRGHEGAFALFLVEANPLLSFDIYVSIYYMEGDFETFIGLGKVFNVQDDKKVQVLVLGNHDFGTRGDAIRNNSVNELARLMIKPSLPSTLMRAFPND